MPEVEAAAPSAATATMRALLVTGPGKTRVEELPRPHPGPGQIRVRLEGSGVCGSSLPVWEGRPWFAYPLEPGAPGHEGWGRVDAIGAGVEGSLLGRRVAALGTNAHATHALARADEAVVLPDELDGLPFPGEPLGCAMNVFARSAIEPGQHVAVVGIGFLGALLVQLAAAAGARVIAVGRRPFALEVARRLGAEEAIAFDDPGGIAERVAQRTEGAGCARVIEAVGSQAPLTLAGRLTAVRGRLVIAGFHQDGTREIDVQHWNWHGIDVINAHERDPQQYVRGMRAAVEAVRSGRLDPAPLYTHVLPLDGAGAAYDLMHDRPDGFLKALVTG